MGKLSKNEINDYKINNIVRLGLYLIYIIIGMVLYAKSYLKFDSIVTFMGVLFIVTGAIYVYMSSREKKIDLSNLDVIFGILAALCGLLLIINPGNINNNLTFYYGLFLGVCGLQKLVVGIKLYKEKDDAAILTIVTAVLIFGLGVVLFLNIFKNTSLTQLCGMFSLFFGIIQLSNTILLNNKEQGIIKKSKK